MPCESYREALTEAAATNAEVAGAARAHLESCADCRAFFAEERTLFSAIDGGLRISANADVPPDLLPRVRARLGAEAAPKRRGVFAPVMLASTAVLLVGFAFVRVSRHVKQPRVGPVIQNAGDVAPPEVVSPREKSSRKTTATMAMRVTRQHAHATPAEKLEEPVVLVPAGQGEAVELLMASLRRGEIKGEVLVEDGNDRDPQLPPISPIDIVPLQIKPLEVATKELR